MPKKTTQEKNAGSRPELVADLNRAAREASGVGVMFSEAVAGRLGVNPTDLECLGVIADHPDITAGEIAAATSLTSGAITGVIDRLETAGYVRRERDPDDRRVVRIRLVPETFARAAALYRSLGEAVDRLAADYTDAELKLFVGYFDRSRAIALAEIARLKALPSKSAARSPARATAAAPKSSRPRPRT
jgi:DNA-binding MarR family transcriptional regulator